MQNVKLSEEIYEDKESGDGTKRTESIMELYITRFDHLTTIECRAINSAMNEPLKATIQFKVLCKLNEKHHQIFILGLILKLIFSTHFSFSSFTCYHEDNIH